MSERADRYEMSITLGVLEHLGLNLYSNVPAVVSEAVANAWDADATEVDIDVETSHQKVEIRDNGVGMDLEDVNERFLAVGYRRREDRPTTTPRGRHVMGRKGIGKLSMFAVANRISVHSVKKSSEPEAFGLDADEIREALESKQPQYRPKAIEPDIQITNGTRIELTRLRRSVNQGTIKYLRRRLARRFSVIGEDFAVRINGEPISVEDREYFDSVEFLWTIGSTGEDHTRVGKASRVTELPGIVDKDKGWTVEGWVGTFDTTRDMPEELNSIVVMAWGKLVDEDVLPRLRATGIFRNYLIGEIHADFLDADDDDDIVTSDRQSMREDDPRTRALIAFLQEQVLKPVGNNWLSWRREAGVEEARENDAVAEWLEGLEGDSRKHAEVLLGEIGRFAIKDDDDRRTLYRHTVLAFERLRLQDALSRIEEVRTEGGLTFLRNLVQDTDELEAVEYHSIVRGRLAVIRAFKDLVDEDAKERALQEHIFDHLWLLDPSWERATTEARMEESVRKEFGKVKLSASEQKARIDIRYRTAAGVHIIVELKRYGTKVKASDLLEQLTKYRNALEKALTEKHGIEHPVIEIVSVLGGAPGGSQSDPEKKALLKTIGARWVTYDSLIENAQRAYQEYLEADDRVARLNQLIDAI